VLSDAQAAVSSRTRIRQLLRGLYLAVAVILASCGGGGGSGGGGGGSTLYSFGNGPTDAAFLGELLQGSDGNFYGTALYGGVNGKGAVVKITPTGVETVLYSFAGGPGDGASPVHMRLIEGSDGNFYGTTPVGGSYGKGTVFKVTPLGVETVLYSFAGGADDGASPSDGLLQGSDGNFYGVTLNGGANDLGTIFKFTPAGIETVLYSFKGDLKGDAVGYSGALVEGSDGNFYGVAEFGGISNQGAVFKITPEGTETVLHSFAGAPSDGDNPVGVTLLKGSDGNFYGTTADGGANGAGAIFKLTPAGIETVLYSFTGAVGDGNFPVGSLVESSDGSLYGTTNFGGATLNDDGTVFKVTLSGNETVLYSFGSNDNDGSEPVVGPTLGTDGALYGTTSKGGANNSGTFFKLVPN
jgi:uncharacterized repeat protein (TIGR03803 family)